MNILLIISLVFVLIEQLFCLFLGSYPYRYGFLIKRIILPVNNVASWKDVQEKCPSLKVRISEQQQEIYCRYKYQFGTSGPFLFTAQAKFSAPGTLLIRLGPGSGLLLLILFINSVLQSVQGSGFYSLLNIAAVFGAALFFYFMLVKSVKQCEHVIAIHPSSME